MTLCVAWRWNEDVYFASDSSIMLENGVRSDLGIKIVELPVCVRTPIDSDSKESRIIFSRKYGLAFSGSYLAGYIVKEFLESVLTRLQYCGEGQHLTIEKIVALIHKIHRYYTIEFRKVIDYVHDLDMIIGGYCPLEKRVKVFRFIASESSKEPSLEEVNNEFPFSYTSIGSGDTGFKILFEENLKELRSVHYNAFSTLRQVINRKIVDTVSGSIQCGKFIGGEFSCLGFLDYVKKDGLFDVKTTIRGVELDEIYTPKDAEDLFVSGSFSSPFLYEVIEQLK